VPDAQAARYVARDHVAHGRRLWWVPPDGGAWERLPLDRPRSPGAVSSTAGAYEVAEAILVHSTGDFTVASTNALAFRATVLDGQLAEGELDLGADEVEGWLRDRDLPLAPGWGPLGPTPVVACSRTGPSSERYEVSLDGWDLLHIDLEDARATARIVVADSARPAAGWSGEITVGEPADGHRAFAAGSRVTSEALPFGGWAVQVDDFDIAIVERHSTSARHARVAVYDRGLDSEFLRFDGNVAYRELVTDPVTIGERLRLFSAVGGPDRAIGR
jgi:hypothetical protein